MSQNRKRGLVAMVRGAEQTFLAFVERYSLQMLRYSLVVVFVWFGLLTAAGIGKTATLVAAALGVGQSGYFLLALGGLEIATGLALLHRRTVRFAFVLVTVHVIVTLAPLVAFPNETFIAFPYAPSFEGVYIIKNWVLLGAVMTVGGERDRSTDQPG